MTTHDAYIDEMDMIGIGHILDKDPHRPRSAFDMFGVFMVEIDDDDFVTDVIHNDFSVEGAFDFVDPPLSFDTMFGFVTRYDGMTTKYHNDMSIFEYSPVSLHFPVIASLTPIAQVHDMEDLEILDDPLGGQPGYDSNSEENKVVPVFGSTKSVDFETLISLGSLRLALPYLRIRGIG